MANVKHIHLTAPSELVSRLNQAAQDLYISRNEYIRAALQDKLREQPDSLVAKNDQIACALHQMTHSQLEELKDLIRFEQIRRRSRRRP